MKKPLLVIITSISILNSCNKGNDHPAITKENIAGSYQLVGKTMSATGIPEQDAYPSLRDCEKDDLYILKTDNSFHYQDAGTICTPPGDFDGNWELNSTTISFYGETGEITKFDGNVMEVTETTDISETTFTVKSTYQKQ